MARRNQNPLISAKAGTQAELTMRAASRRVDPGLRRDERLRGQL